MRSSTPGRACGKLPRCRAFGSASFCAAMALRNKRIWLVTLAAIAAVWLVGAAGVAYDRLRLRRVDALGVSLSGPQEGAPLPVLWRAPAFSALDQDGRAASDEALRRHVWIADFIFTRCTTACPLISAKMLLLRQAITSPDVRFVSFSVDPTFDTPAVLKQYARRWQDDGRWVLLSTEPAAVQDIARAMKVPLERSSDPQNPILHSTSFFLVDGSGNLRGIYDSVDDDAVRRLVADARSLDAASGSPARAEAHPFAASDASEADRGRRLFESTGCAACHADGRVAPPLDGVFGRAVRLQGGGTTTADEAYLRESILEPNARMVEGYLPLMPSYRGHLSDGQIADLVAYLRSTPSSGERPSAEPNASATPAMAVDPVCGMQVRAAAESPHTTYRGKVYYFCSDTCRQRFGAAPAKYVR